MNTGITTALQQIYDQLPLYAEEGGDYTAVPVSEIASSISAEDKEATLPVVLLVQRIFTLLGVLDSNLLHQNIWRFVSFPASLLARSTLKSLADSDQSLFESSFWNQQDSNSPVSDDKYVFG